jgi:uncharacterized protein YqgV (UPF0045/DUF77 family)
LRQAWHSLRGGGFRGRSARYYLGGDQAIVRWWRTRAHASPSEVAMNVTAEFTTEPFRGEGAPPAHAVAARDRLCAAGLEPEFGPLGTSVHGDRETVLPALLSVLEAVLDTDAHRITLQITVDDEP